MTGGAETQAKQEKTEEAPKSVARTLIQDYYHYFCHHNSIYTVSCTKWRERHYAQVDASPLSEKSDKDRKEKKEKKEKKDSRKEVQEGTKDKKDKKKNAEAHLFLTQLMFLSLWRT